MFFQQQPQNLVLKANKTKTMAWANQSDESKFQTIVPFQDAHQKAIAESQANPTNIFAQT
ncbi:MAG: hypothetical protein A2831_03010 [Candidatus Yanofskybacteria bacterium RIFCSPHIGHO2_01_FULL_44_17]|uniref:Uncharacterized protein n=1 Tax=Candidatus Yanofskybacteria bacterium RIFCSPHIGHO2_01_FULL_44_17 TaxID=1802668 RepID=A0A1F8EY90_9BACT|nr:MAG: hypothetical protein A2831_03010 [Candidatus Yanofskybacteria bacterium RIFCSPHIGHO2_01_FULL_44_17]